MSIHCINSVLYICLRRARNGACRYVGYFDYFKNRYHTLRSKLHAAKNPTEIHGALNEVCGGFTVVRSSGSRWANLFVVVV